MFDSNWSNGKWFSLYIRALQPVPLSFPPRLRLPTIIAPYPSHSLSHPGCPSAQYLFEPNIPQRVRPPLSGRRPACRSSFSSLPLRRKRQSPQSRRSLDWRQTWLMGFLDRYLEGNPTSLGIWTTLNLWYLEPRLLCSMRRRRVRSIHLCWHSGARSLTLRLRVCECTVFHSLHLA